MRHRVQHRLLGDGVEDDARDRLVLERALLLQDLQHVPGDRLALAVGVGGEDEAVGALHRPGNVGQALLRLGVDIPEHVEVLLGIDGAVLGGKIAHVAIRGDDLVARPEIFVDRLRLRRRFDDDDLHAPAVSVGGVQPEEPGKMG